MLRAVMPILKGAMTFSRFRARHKGERPRDPKRWLAKGFRAHAFEPLEKNAEEDTAQGWVEIENADSTELSPQSFLYGDLVLASYRIDRLRVPAAAIRAELDTWSRAFTEREARPPRRSEKAEEKELITKRLRKRAFPRTTLTDLSWNLTTDHLEIWTTQKSVTDEIQTSLETVFELRLLPLAPGAYASTLDLTDDQEELLKPTAELLCDPAFGA
jgi:recombination associated protein RdgC